MKTDLARATRRIGKWILRFRPPQCVRSQDQATIAGWLSLAAVAMACSWAVGGWLTDGWVSIEAPPPVALRDGTDLNHADWPELTLLPGISRTMAQRIVASRRQLGPFRGPADLQRVSGIGPKTIARLRPYLAGASDPPAVSRDRKQPADEAPP